MENLDLNELIERYLDGSLPAEMQQEVETRLATDADFKAEVELHRQLQTELADPKKMQLRDLLQEVVQEPLPAPAKPGWLKLVGTGLAALLVLWALWVWLSPTPTDVPAPVRQEETKPVTPDNQPVAMPPGQNEPPKTDVKEAHPHIAMANPAAFHTNRDFEARLGSQIRDAGGAATVASPATGADFTPKDGFVRIRFRGAANADGDATSYPLHINIYSNEPNPDKPMFLLRPEITDRNAGSWDFSTMARLRLQPGLYYFTVERQAGDDLIFVGKFTVGAR
jgi:hypothetical protein